MRATSRLALSLLSCASCDPRAEIYIPVGYNALTYCGSLGGSVIANLLGLGIEKVWWEGRKIESEFGVNVVFLWFVR